MNPKHSLFFFYLQLVISNFYNRQTLKAKQTNKQKIKKKKSMQARNFMEIYCIQTYT